MTQETKKTVVAGMFYPEGKTELEKMLTGFFDKTKLLEKIESPKAVVCPHAGYVYSGPVASFSYELIKSKRKNLKKNFVIMAPSHHTYFEGVSIGMYKEFQTPLGNIKVNQKICNDIIQKHPDYFSFQKEAYEQEHALEVQLPFLKYISQSDFQIVPMIFGHTNPIKIGEILSEIYNENEIFFVVSSDLSHYMAYEDAKKIDNLTLKYFLDKDIENIANYGDACGISPWLSLTQIAIKNNRNAKLLNYQNSGDTAGDKRGVVGYASLAYF